MNVPDPNEDEVLQAALQLPDTVTLAAFLTDACEGDFGSKRVMHYLNGRPVSEKPLKIDPPFRIGTAELGNWNARGFPDNDPSLIRNFSGAMDEFCLFRRALNDYEIHELYSAGKPQPDSAAGRRN